MPRKLAVAGGLSLPIDVLTMASATLGIRGSGKTNTAVVVTEELLAAGEQVVALDPLDVWWGLKSSADGKSAGHPVTVFGGPHGDVPIDRQHGGLVAEFVVEQRVSAVVSLRHLSKAGQRQFAADFAERVYELKGQSRYATPCLFVVDEASSFVPQRVDAGEARMVGAFEDWVTRGRASGIGVMLIDQRAARVNKNVLTQVELLVCHRTTSPQDRKALKEWVEAHDAEGREAAFFGSLAALQTGEAWFWSPSWLDVFERVRVRPRKTFDSSATPKVGVRPAPPRVLAPVDLDRLKEKFAQVLEERKRNDPAELHKQILELKRQLAERLPTAAPAVDVDRRVSEELAKAEAHWRGQLAPWVRGYRRLERAVTEAAAAAAEPPPPEPAPYASAPVGDPPITPRQDRAIPSLRMPRVVPSAPATADDGFAIRGPMQKLLDAAAWWNIAGVWTPSRYQLGFVAGIKPTGGHFSNTIGPLVTHGFLENLGDGRVKLTEKGRSFATRRGSPGTLAEYHDAIRQILKSGPMRRIFDVIVTRHGRTVDVETIGREAGINPAGGHFSNSIGPLSTLGLIERKGGAVIPTELCFPPGLH